MIARADILVENFRPGTLEKWGLDYDTLSGDNPGLIMVRVSGYIRERSRSKLPNVAPSNIYDCADGMILIAANQDTVFKRLCEAMEKPELATDPRFASHSGRGDHQELLDDIISDWSKKLSVESVSARMEKHSVPAGLIFSSPRNAR